MAHPFSFRVIDQRLLPDPLEPELPDRLPVLDPLDPLIPPELLLEPLPVRPGDPAD